MGAIDTVRQALDALQILGKELLGRKGGPGSGNWAHTSFQRIEVGRGGSDPKGTATVSIEGSPKQIADRLDTAITHVGRPIPITVTGKGQSMPAYVMQKKLGSRVWMSVPKRGDSGRRDYFTFSMKGKSRGQMRHEYSESVSLLQKQGFTPESGYLARWVPKPLGEKGGPGSGNWAHTSFQRVQVGRGGSDPKGMFGGALAALGLDSSSTPEERRAASAQFRDAMKKKPYLGKGAPRGKAIEGPDASGKRARAMLMDGLPGSSWENADKEARRGAKAELVQELADRSGVDYDVANSFVRQWSRSSNNHDMRSLAMQRDAANTYGVPLSRFQRGRIDGLNKELEGRIQGLVDQGMNRRDAVEQLKSGYGNSKLFALHSPTDQSKILSSMYEYTQDRLADAGFKPGDTVRMLRGVRLFNDELEGLQNGDSISVIGNTMASWATYSSSGAKRVADTFKGHTGGGKTAVVLAMDVPIELIAGSARSGYGCLTEGEFIVLNSVPGSTSTIVDGL